MEVGTGDGRGTTEALFLALRAACRAGGGGGGFRLFTYEADPELHARARTRWVGQANVRAVNEVVMNLAGLERLVLPNVYAGRFTCREIGGLEADCEPFVSCPCFVTHWVTSLCPRPRAPHRCAHAAHGEPREEQPRAVTPSRDSEP